MNRKELLAKAKECGIKGIYRMKKDELETAIYIYQCASWFNDMAGNIIVINNGEEYEVDISSDIIDLEKKNTDYKKWDIKDEEKINFLLS